MISCEKFVIRFTGSRSEVFCEKGVLKNFAKFTGKHEGRVCSIGLMRDIFPAERLESNPRNFNYHQLYFEL